jgi:high-affinity nickel-transport protein
MGAGAAAPSRRERIRDSLTREEWRRAGALAAAITALHVIGFGLLFAFVVPGHFDLGGGTGIFGVGVGLTAYTLGLRHAFDADHIGAIDNTTRKLMADGQRPLSVGFFFSLGHSTIVFGLAALFAVGVRGLSGAVSNDDSQLHQATSLVGPAVSGSFLFLIGILNLIVLVSIVKVFRRMRHGDFDEQELEEQLNRRGFMNRFYGRAARAVKKPWQMYPLGCLFGLGFDTATEIALLATAGTAAAGGLPLYAILCLPILFAAGMSLLDTIDGAFMNFAYGWAFSKPVRKVFYNITITGLSRPSWASAAVCGTGSPTWTSTSSATPSSACSWSRGYWPCRSGTSGTSRRNGQPSSSERNPRSGGGGMTQAPEREPLAFDDLDGVVAAIRERGGRVTAARRIVLEALFAADGPVSAEYIADGLGGRVVRSEVSSVYRNLELLEELGVVRHVHLGHGPGLYALEGRTQREYLVCERCHRVDAVDAGRLDRVREQIRADFGYEAAFGHFPIVGLCAACAAGAEATADHGHSHGGYVHSHPHAHPHSH